MIFSQSLSCFIIIALLLLVDSSFAESESLPEASYYCENWVSAYERDALCQVIKRASATESVKIFAKTKILRYELEGQPSVYFRAEGDISKNVSTIIQSIFENWIVEDGNYGQGHHFALYSSEEDLLHQTNEWSYCPTQNNRGSGWGIPGTCRPVQPEFQNSQTERSMRNFRPFVWKECLRKHQRIAVCSPPESSNSNKQFLLSSSVISGSSGKIFSHNDWIDLSDRVLDSASRRSSSLQKYIDHVLGYTKFLRSATQEPKLKGSAAGVERGEMQESGKPYSLLKWGSKNTKPLKNFSHRIARELLDSSNCSISNFEVEKIEIGTRYSSDEYCPGLVDMEIRLMHQLGKNAGIAIDLTFITSYNLSYASYEVICPWLRTLDSSNVNLCIIPANLTPPVADWQLRITASDDSNCTFIQTISIEMPAADNISCADPDLQLECLSKNANSLLSFEGSFGGILSETVLSDAESEEEFYCEVFNNETGLVAASMPVFVDSSNGRITCGSGALIRVPAGVLVTSNIQSTPLYMQYLEADCSEADGGESSATVEESKGTGFLGQYPMRTRVVIYIALSIAGLFVSGVLALVILRSTRHLLRGLSKKLCQPRQERRDSWDLQDMSTLGSTPVQQSNYNQNTSKQFCKPRDVELNTFTHRRL